MKKEAASYDLVVCGGGLAGFCAAVAAARLGTTTCLIQDRPVFGGNSSSEIRVTPHGAACFHAYARETGIISELLIEDRARNHDPIIEGGWTNSIWDMVLYDMAVNTPNLTFHVNTAVKEVVMDGGRRIAALKAHVANAEVELTIEGETFIDCTGDGVIADLAGCEWRMGSEARSEFDEPHAPLEASADTMGNSLHFRARDIGRPAPFTPPSWAVNYTDPKFFYEQGRIPYKIEAGYWWIEIGMPWNTIHDNETIRTELTKHLFGVWNYMKNVDPDLKQRTRNLALDWVGQVPGKRESRRIMGRYFMTEHDVHNLTVFPDEVGFGGWFVDLHTVGGLLAETSEPASAEGYKPTTDYARKTYVGPYGFPLRILISKDVDNLMMAGRNISVTHAALGTIRVMATTALMGQAAGTAASIARRHSIPIADAPGKVGTEIQQQLLRDGCFLPNYRNEDPADLARSATATASTQALLHGAGLEDTLIPEHPKPSVRESDLPLTALRGQLIAVGTNRLDEIAVCLTNTSGSLQPLNLRLTPVEHIWDYRADTGTPIATATLDVPPGGKQWITWPANANVQPGRYVRLDLRPNPNIIWHASNRWEPGHVSMYDMGEGRMRRMGGGVTMAFRVSPPQPVYGPANVLSGVTRPHRFTNLWRSDPNDPADQWIELAWNHPQEIATVELTFPGHLVVEYHGYPPFYRDPQCARDYTLSALVDGRWQALHREEGNYQRHRRHTLPDAVRTDRLRVTIHATNGDPSAAVYEIRCYGP